MKKFDNLVDILGNEVLYNVELSLTRLKRLGVGTGNDKAYVLVSDEYAGRVVNRFFEVSKYGYVNNPNLDKEHLDELNLPTLKKAVFNFLQELIEEDKYLELAEEFKDNDKAILKVIWK